MPFPNKETQFQPGQSGNEGGRPRKLPSIDKLLVDVLGDENDENSQAKAILKALVKKAQKGDVRAAEILLDRGFGRPRQQVEIGLTPQVKSFKIVRASDTDK